MAGQSETARPGYTEIQAASNLHPDSGAWAYFMREIVRLPLEMTPAVHQVIRQEKWRRAPDPLATLRADALQAHQRAWAKASDVNPSQERNLSGVRPAAQK